MKTYRYPHGHLNHWSTRFSLNYTITLKVPRFSRSIRRSSDISMQPNTRAPWSISSFRYPTEPTTAQAPLQHRGPSIVAEFGANSAIGNAAPADAGN